MLGRSNGGKKYMCALAAVAVAVLVVGQVPTSGSARNISVMQFPGESGMPGFMLDEISAIENSFVHAFDNLVSGMAGDEIMANVSRALGPRGGFPGEYEVVFCHVGVREENGALVVSLKVKYDLSAGRFAAKRELEKSTILTRGAGKNA